MEEDKESERQEREMLEELSLGFMSKREGLEGAEVSQADDRLNMVNGHAEYNKIIN